MWRKWSTERGMQEKHEREGLFFTVPGKSETCPLGEGFMVLSREFLILCKQWLINPNGTWTDGRAERKGDWQKTTSYSESIVVFSKADLPQSSGHSSDIEARQHTIQSEPYTEKHVLDLARTEDPFLPTPCSYSGLFGKCSEKFLVSLSQQKNHAQPWSECYFILHFRSKTSESPNDSKVLRAL